METSAMQIMKYLESLEGASGSRLRDVIDDEVFEVLAGVAWVRQALTEFSHRLASEALRNSGSSLKSLAA
jgi:hypothetical protein